MSAACGHSACRQHYIDTGSTDCILSIEDLRAARAKAWSDYKRALHCGSARKALNKLMERDDAYHQALRKVRGT